MVSWLVCLGVYIDVMEVGEERWRFWIYSYSYFYKEKLFSFLIMAMGGRESLTQKEVR